MASSSFLSGAQLTSRYASRGVDRDRSALVFVAAVYAAIGSACSLGALDGFAGGAEGDGGVAAIDASGAARDDAGSAGSDALPPGDSATDAADAGDADGVAGRPNLAQNPGFENGSSCGPPWTNFESTLTIDTEKRSGTQSCKVCRGSAGDSSFTIGYSGTLDANASIGAKYHALAYVRRASGAPTGAELVLRTWGPSSTTDKATSISVPLDATWRLVEVTGTINISPGAVDLYVVSAGTSTTDCFSIDDVYVERLQ
jgi:hypothetical protein